MPTTFNVPKSPAKSVLTIDNFQGVDFTNSPANIDNSKSPNAVNMIRDVPGKVRKCMGYKTIKTYRDGNNKPLRINGFHLLRGDAEGFVHAGGSMFWGRVWLYDAANDKRSKAWQFEQKLYMLDGKEFLMLTSEAVDNPNGYTRGLHETEVESQITYTETLNLKNGDVVNFYMPFECSQLDVEYNGTTDTISLADVDSYEFTNSYGDYECVFTFYATVTTETAVLSQSTPVGKLGLNTVCSFDADGNDIQSILVEYDVGDGVILSETIEPTGSVTTYDWTNDIGEYEFYFTVTDTGSVEVGNVSYKNTLGYSGTHTSVINAELVNGFVDDRTGTYVDENNYQHIVKKVSDIAYIPTLTISRSPGGGGEPYEDLNLLSSGFTEMFLGETGKYDYQMSFTDLDDTPPKAWVMNGQGVFVEKVYGTDFSYNKTTGIVHFTNPPGQSPLTGQDNVKITAYRTVPGYADKINKCTIGIIYGVNGATDRLFVSGNPEFINYDWYSGWTDPTYFTDTSYSLLGTASSAVIGYSIISNYLAAHKDYMEKDQNIILRQGDLVNSEPAFRIINTLQGAGAIAPFSFAYLSTEPLFLTKQGVFAVTAQDITGEKYAQNRSYYVNGKLLDELNLEDAFGFVYKDMYWLCLNDVAYILDGLQPLQTDRSMPYATRQYAGFYRNNLPARVMWEKDDICYFGTADGRICEFYTDKYALASYNDDGEPIEAVWETPDIDGKLFYKNKTLRYVALRLDSALATSVNIWVMNRGLWQFIKKDETSGRYFSFMHLVFSKLSFSGDKTQHTISTKVRVKKVDKFRLRLVNNDKDEPFGLYNIAFEYVENGNYKG